MKGKIWIIDISYSLCFAFFISAMLIFQGCSNSNGPGGLRYSMPDAVYTKDGKILDNIPTVNGTITKWSVNPMLPVGLSLNSVTGIISGTPIAVQEKRAYKVTASNATGDTSTEISITVNISPPLNLSYLYTECIYNEGGVIINNVPAVSGSGITFSISPALTAGLSLDPNTGIIWGTPSAASGRTEYTVTAANSSGSAGTVLYMTVTLLNPPGSLSYSSPNSVYTAGHIISNNIPNVSGSGITFSMNTALPAGLSLDSASGIISGIPVSVQSLSTYTVSAENSKGTASTTIAIQVKADALLSSLSLSSGILFSDFNPFTSGYTIRLASSTSSITVTPTASDFTGALITVNGISVVSGQQSGSIATNHGENIISIIVTAGDAYTTSTYTFRGVKGFLPEAYVKAGNSKVMDRFGQSVSISGDTMVVGSPYESSSQMSITNGTGTPADINSPGSGAVYVYRKTGGIWVQEAYLKASNADADDNFGRIVAIDGDVIAVSATQEDSNQKSVTNGSTASSDNSSCASGAVYVFRRTGTAWVQEAYLKASNEDANDNFGSSLGISGDTIVVGTYIESSNQSTTTNGIGASDDNSNLRSGAAYVFRRTGGNWDQEAYLKASNNDPGDNFGISVAISGDTIVVGAYQEDSNQTTITNATSSSVNNSAASSGAAYVYRRTGTDWAQEAYLKASNNASGNYFGNSVSIHEDTIVAGAYYRSSQAGTAYVFKRTGTAWAEEAFLTAPNAESGDYFGYRVAVYADIIAVSAFYEASNQKTCSYGTSTSSNNSAARAGAVYVYKRSGSTWSNDSYLKAPNADTYDYFGSSLAVWGNTITVGAPVESSTQNSITNGITASSDNNAFESGAVYVFYE